MGHSELEYRYSKQQPEYHEGLESYQSKINLFWTVHE